MALPDAVQLARDPTARTIADAYGAFAAQQTFAFAPDTLYAPIRYAVATPGKQVRPTLLLLAYALRARDPGPALPAAFAVDLFHNFTLVHDDIMDAAALRRGQPSVHARFGVPTAILAGDAMMIRTYSYFLDNYAPALAVDLLGAFQAMAVALCEGQQRDMDMEAAARATYDDYLRMIAGKTGILIATSLYIGGRIAGLDPGEAAELRHAGDLAGRAFQIQDDLLDTFSDSARTGKGDHGDIYRGKQSAPYLRALDLARPDEAVELERYYAMSAADRTAHVPRVLELYRSLGIEDALRAEVVALSREASSRLGALSGHADARQRLIAYTEALALRES